jgi:hypothetical protein
VAAQQLSHPVGTDLQPGAFLEVGGQARTRPACEGEAQLVWIRLGCAHQQRQVLGVHTRRTTGARRIGQSFQSQGAPALAPPVYRAWRHAQGLGDAGGALPLRAPQDDGRPQSHAPFTLLPQDTQEPLPLRRRQLQTPFGPGHRAAPPYPSGERRYYP